MSAPHEPGRVYENSLSTERRRRDGIHYTPPDVAASLVAEALARSRPDPRLLLDPACGAGVFLLAALDALVADGVDPQVALTRVRGLDIDPEAVRLARRALADWAVRHRLDPDAVPIDAVTVADALIDDWPAPVDVVVGNPPFGGQLRGSTVRTGVRPDVAAAVLGRRAGYADNASLFMARAVDRVSAGGVVVLVQPMSVLSARDAGIARDYVSARATVRRFLFPDASGFSASVHLCAPVIVVDRSPTERSWCDMAADDLGMAPGPPPGRMVLG
ncbi:MAG: methyltransferase, partial [Acidimicrobiia bacterium]|nr:methyltransferase [Acidimicrobiia bacterium]